MELSKKKSYPGDFFNLAITIANFFFKSKMALREISAFNGIAIHSLCSLSLLLTFCLYCNLYSYSLSTHTSQTLAISLIVHVPIVIGLHSLVRRDRQQCSYLKSVVRGLLVLPVGSLLIAFGAIVLGAPVGIRYLRKTVYWSLLMSLFTFVPVTCAFGTSRVDWHRILAHFKPKESLDAVVSLPAYGSITGAWIGAWLMPLDWERPWQEWPICVTYGAVAGYLIGALASSVFILIHRPVQLKED